MSQNDINQGSYSEAAETHARPKWTIMVYLAGDNNLSANSIAIMQELEAAYHGRNVRLLACYDSNAPLPKGARYLEINHRRYHSGGDMDWGLHNDMVYPGHFVVGPDLCNDNPATIQPTTEPTAREGLSRFLGWALRNHPADRYMLILYGHGTLVGGNTFLGDTTPPSFLRLSDFVAIIKRHFGAAGSNLQGHPKPRLDILACDNCVMNGIESAYEIREYVDYMIGSQGLMLAVGWPFKRIVDEVYVHATDHTKSIARRVLKACARHLLDFSLMERSSEQAVVDLTKLRQGQLVHAVKCLADALKEALKTDSYGHVCYPEIRDDVRLARLEAQSYWDETFVDLYDFCELLLKKCNKYLGKNILLINQYAKRFLQFESAAREADAAAEPPPLIDLKDFLLNDVKLGQHYAKIAECCDKVLKAFNPENKPNKPRESSVVPYAYYVCPNLQYSHGLSIYFPWTMPEDPVIFERKRTSWPYADELEDYILKTAFDEYKSYAFAGHGGTDWAGFLLQFFKATLRNVRRVEYEYKKENSNPFTIFEGKPLPEKAAPPTSLQKSSSDTGEQDDSTEARIKNYPRRFYLSPQDCRRRCHPYEVKPLIEEKCDRGPIDALIDISEETNGKHCVSYLGWNIRGLVAEVVGLPPQPHIDSDASDEDSESELES